MEKEDSSVLRMPAGFLWGAGTASHQNEGGNRNNQWATWEQGAGHIHAGQRAGIATDWWNQESAAADFDRAAELGMNSLRISVEWSRVEPESGVFDQSALRKYAEMVRLLRVRGLEPMVTLHHFTDPLWLTEIGAWENPLIEDYFSRYVTRVVEALGDQVTLWCTINEPFVYAYSGFLEGVFPPGAKNMRRTLHVLRQMLLAHGRAYRVIHRLQNNAQVGVAHNMRLHLPADPSREADRRATALINQVCNGTTLTAITEGRLLPLIGIGQTVPQLIDSCDYIGLNYYSTARVAFDPRRPADLFARRFFDPNVEWSDPVPPGDVAYGEINPEGMYLALKEVASYGKPIYITENGVPDSDDDVRPRFIVTHLAEAWRAIQDGVDLRGYYHWTLVDNFEWAAGWSLRFGLYELDPQSGARTMRTSGAVYQSIAQANGIPRSIFEKVTPSTAGAYYAEDRAR